MNTIMTNTGTNATASGATASGASLFARDGYARTDHHALTANDLEGAKVYGHGDDSIGAISDLIVAEGGKITHAVVDVGGFLGMGAHPVSMPFADLTVLRADGGSDLRIHVDATKAQLEAMPRHDG